MMLWFVIDVLRSFSTAAYAFAAGASLIYRSKRSPRHAACRPPCQTPDNRSRRGWRPDPLVFDFGNTPTVFQNLRLDNRPLIQSTAAGAHGITRFNQVRALFAGSLVCARATAAAIAALNPSEVTFVITESG